MSYIFTWVPVYKAISDNLETYVDNGNALADILIQLGIDTTDEVVPGQKVPLDDIEPLSFISCLNKFSDERALDILRRLCDIWTIPLKVYDLAGIPRSDPRKAYTFPYKRDRKNNEIRRLWDLFGAVRTGTLDDAIVSDVLTIHGLGWPKLTEGLFMFDPNSYLCLNGMVRPYLESKGITIDFNSYTDYLQLLDKIKTVVNKPFYEISHDSYRWKKEKEQAPKYWRIGTTAGTGGNDILPEMLNEEVVSIGWEELGNLSTINPLSQTIVRDKLFEAKTYDTLRTCGIKAGEIYAFKTKIHINDYVFACKGGRVRAIGRVLHDQYIYNPDLDFPHCRSVDWIKKDIDDLSITGTQQTVNEIYLGEDLAKINNYLSKGSNKSEPQIAVKMSVPSINTILYGPPGTGKTYYLQSLFATFTDRPKAISAEETRAKWLRNATWWEVLAHVLYGIPDGISVPALKQNDLIKEKFAQSDIKNASARLWSTLQHHTVVGCPNVALDRRLTPPLFWKENNSIWRMDNREEFAAEYPELVTGPNTPEAALQPELAKRYRFTTAHQSWGYEDFVEGIKPRLSREAEQDEDAESAVSYHIENGLFYNACDEAARLAGYKNLQDALNATKDHRKSAFANAPKFSVFIDEINRANVSAVLGELITLIEDDKRLGSENEISDTRLPYSRRLFGVPANLYIIATMNTADRSVEALDTALRRRFAFVEMTPDENHKYVASSISISGTNFNFQEILTVINKRLERILGRDHKIGHSYFIDSENSKGWQFYLSAFTDKIVPLMQEYFYGDYAKVCLVLGKGFVNEINSAADDKFFAVADYDGIEELQEKRIWQIEKFKPELPETEQEFASALITLLNK